MVNFCFDCLQELSMVWDAVSNTQKSVPSNFQTSWSSLGVWILDETLFLMFDVLYTEYLNIIRMLGKNKTKQKTTTSKNVYQK